MLELGFWLQWSPIKYYLLVLPKWYDTPQMKFSRAIKFASFLGDEAGVPSRRLLFSVCSEKMEATFWAHAIPILLDIPYLTKKPSQFFQKSRNLPLFQEMTAHECIISKSLASYFLNLCFLEWDAFAQNSDKTVFLEVVFMDLWNINFDFLVRSFFVHPSGCRSEGKSTLFYHPRTRVSFSTPLSRPVSVSSLTEGTSSPSSSSSATHPLPCRQPYWLLQMSGSVMYSELRTESKRKKTLSAHMPMVEGWKDSEPSE